MSEKVKMTIKILAAIGIGLVLFDFWNGFVNMKWDSVGSRDVLSGAIIEFFLFTFLFEMYQNRQAKQWKNDMALHLKEIEKLLRSDKNDN